MKTKIIRSVALLTLAAALLGAFSGCAAPAESGDKLKVVCTIFPQYDWARQVIGQTDGVELELLLGSGTDLHSYQASAEDIIKLSTCDLLVYVGGESDSWIEEALEGAFGVETVNMLELLKTDAHVEELVEGMQGEDEHEHDEHDDEHEGAHDDEHDEVEYDEHVWLSLRNAQTVTRAISDALSRLDGDNAAAYAENCEAYCGELARLDGEYAAAVDAAKGGTLLFCDRFPFRYMVEDYGLDYYAAFVGCSAETEASFETIAFLAGKADELGLKNVLITESSDGSIARTVIASGNDSGRGVLTLDSMQSVTREQADGGTTYLGVMESDLLTLKEALG